MLVEGRRNPARVDRSAGTFDDVAGFVDRLLPLSLNLHDLGPMHAALTGEDGELRLGTAPRVEGGGPFTRPVDREHPVTAADHGAIEDAGHERTQEAPGGCQHRFVEERESARVISAHGECFALEHAGEVREIGLVEALADLDCPARRVACLGCIPVSERSKRTRNEQVAALDALRLVFDQAFRTTEPAHAPARFAGREQADSQPERGARCRARLAGGNPEIMQSLQCSEIGVVVPGQGSRPREPLEVLVFEGRLTVGIRERFEGIAPGMGSVRLASPLQLGSGCG